MADFDNDSLKHNSPALVRVCGLIGLTLCLIWCLWPASFDPLSVGLSRTPLFSRLLFSSADKPAVLDLSPTALQGTPPPPAETMARIPLLLEQVFAEAPAVIAVAATDRDLSSLLKSLTRVTADPQAKLVLLPITAKEDASEPPASDPLPLAGWETKNGKLRFNVLAGGEITTGFLETPPRSSSNRPFRTGANARPSFAHVIVSRFVGPDHDRGISVSGPIETPIAASAAKLRPGEAWAVVGGNNRFYDYYSATAFLERRIPHGALEDRIVLLGPGPGSDRSRDIAGPVDLTAVEATAFKVWALLNDQIAIHPPWALWVELGLVLGCSLFPAVVVRRFSSTGTGLVLAALALFLVAVMSVVWHLSGVMIQMGPGMLGLGLSSLVVTLLSNGHPRSQPAGSKQVSAPENAFRPSPQASLTADENNQAVEIRPAATADTAFDNHPPSFAEVTSAVPPVDRENQKIGRYEILRGIGKGAMGEVFLGRDPHINRLTAIKTLHFEDNFAPDEILEIKEKFFREAESAGTLSHANIVTIYDAGEDRDQAYIAMEYLEGITLLRFTRSKRLLPVRKIIAYSAQIAAALDYAHDRGIVHRDIKPANIMVLKNGDIKITDFGIARIAASSHTQTGVVKGTPYYMSPEQFSGDKVDGRSDIFSLGTMLFQLLTGTLPFFSESPAVLMNQIMNFPHPNPRAINPRVIPAIIPIVDKALEKNRERRYATAGQMATDLTKLNRRINAYLRRKTGSDREH
jgi:predicted Ser/Thr protein kinase